MIHFWWHFDSFWWHAEKWWHVEEWWRTYPEAFEDFSFPGEPESPLFQVYQVAFQTIPKYYKIGHFRFIGHFYRKTVTDLLIACVVAFDCAIEDLICFKVFSSRSNEASNWIRFSLADIILDFVSKVLRGRAPVLFRANSEIKKNPEKIKILCWWNFLVNFRKIVKIVSIVTVTMLTGSERPWLFFSTRALSTHCLTISAKTK